MPPLVRKAMCYPGKKRLQQGFDFICVCRGGGGGRGGAPLCWRSFPEEENKVICCHSTIRRCPRSAGTSQQSLAAFSWLNMSLSRISHTLRIFPTLGHLGLLWSSQLQGKNQGLNESIYCCRSGKTAPDRKQGIYSRKREEWSDWMVQINST